MLYKVHYFSSLSILLICLLFIYYSLSYFKIPWKDSCNRKSNQNNLGTIKSSNLCTEIIEFSSPDETAVCNLASIALPRFVMEKVNYPDIFSLCMQFGINCYPWFYNNFYLQNVPIDSHPSKLVGSIGAKNRFFDFDKLAEVWLLLVSF